MNNGTNTDDMVSPSRNLIFLPNNAFCIRNQADHSVHKSRDDGVRFPVSKPLTVHSTSNQHCYDEIDIVSRRFAIFGMLQLSDYTLYILPRITLRKSDELIDRCCLCSSYQGLPETERYCQLSYGTTKIVRPIQYWTGAPR